MRHPPSNTLVQGSQSPNPESGFREATRVQRLAVAPGTRSQIGAAIAPLLSGQLTALADTHSPRPAPTPGVLRVLSTPPTCRGAAAPFRSINNKPGRRGKNKSEQQRQCQESGSVILPHLGLPRPAWPLTPSEGRPQRPLQPFHLLFNSERERDGIPAWPPPLGAQREACGRAGYLSRHPALPADRPG